MSPQSPYPIPGATYALAQLVQSRRFCIGRRESKDCPICHGVILYYFERWLKQMRDRAHG